MELLKALALGFIQGATEFLPVSSSGHLVLGSHILGFREQGLVFDVALHLGTLVSVLIVFRVEIVAMLLAPFRWLAGRRDEAVRSSLLLDVWVIVGTIPAVIVGLLFKQRIEVLFTSVATACVMLAVTGVMMISTTHLRERGIRLNSARAAAIGCGQALAIMPGLSRSGTTIFVGLLLGINRETVARFSFILSVPAILGAAVLNGHDLLTDPPQLSSALNLLAGTVTAAVTGYGAIILLLDLIRRNRLQWFGYYCLVVAGAGLLILFLLN